MIHPAINKTEVAVRYYKLKYPDWNESNPCKRGYSRETARKMFYQDDNINKKVVKDIILGIFKEQKELFKAKPNL